jgi:hypothetical protein
MKASKAQLRALEKLREVVPSSFYLAGGVGVALHLGHRRSHDLDLFGPEDPRKVVSKLEAAAGVSIVDRAKGTLHLEVGGVPTSLLEYRYRLLDAPVRVEGVALPIASLDDLATMKLAAIGDRGAARDFWDLHAIIDKSGESLEHYVAAFRKKFPRLDPGHVIRGLVYFGDAEADPLPRGLNKDRWARIRADLERRVRALSL